MVLVIFQWQHNSGYFYKTKNAFNRMICISPLSNFCLSVFLVLDWRSAVKKLQIK